MLFSPEAHEALADEPWSADRVRRAIASIVADAESAFDDGWPLHPQDKEDEDDAGTRFRTVYLGGAGVVDALHRLARRASSSYDGTMCQLGAFARSAHSRSAYGRGRYTLWTGDLGTALYLADCTDGGGELPLP
jgi:hypothetical protein